MLQYIGRSQTEHIQRTGESGPGFDSMSPAMIKRRGSAGLCSPVVEKTDDDD